MRISATPLFAQLALLIALFAPVHPSAGGASSPGIPEDAHYLSEVPVAAPGTYKIALDSAALMQGGRFEDWRIIAPDGRVLPVALLQQQPLGGHDARSVALDETPEGWQIQFDLGAAPVLHEKLHLEPGRFVQAKDCLLEDSYDRKNWETLTRGDLYSMGDTANLHGAKLAYPPSSKRYLRLSWPRAAGFPQFNSARVEISGGDGAAVKLSVAFTPVAQPPSHPERTRFDFSLSELHAGAAMQPPSALRLTLSEAPPERFALQLWRGNNGGWEVVQMAHRRLGSIELGLAGDSLSGGDYRLEFHGSGAAAPALKTIEAEYPPRWLVFRADSPGAYRLVYGARRPASFARLPVEELTGDMVVAVAGAARQLSAPPLPAQALLPLPVPVRWNPQAAWKVLPPEGGRPGELVLLELPAAVLTTTRSDLNHLHLLQGRRPVPFLLRPLSAPALAWEKNDVNFAPASQAQQFEYSIDLTPLALERMQLEISTPPAPFNRTLAYAFESAARPGIEPPLHEQTGVNWSCKGTDLTPCRMNLDLYVPPGARRLILRIDNHDNPAMPAIDIRLWRARTALVFGWPSEAGLVLAWHPGDAAGPFPAFAMIDELLAERPAARVLIDESAQVSPDSPWARHARLALLAALALAGAMLLWILARMLKKTEPPAAVTP